MRPAPVQLVQFTDLHLYGAADGRLRGIATRPALEAALTLARRREAPWEAMLLTGDLVQDDAAGYAQVREVFGTSTVPVYCIPGNHDEIRAMRSALAAPPFQIGGTACHGEWLLVMLDSYLHGMAAGRVGEPELARLDAALAENANRHALVCLHHHPVPMGSRWLDAVGLQNPDALFDVLDRHSNVRLLVWGHVHQAWEGTRNGVRLLCTPSTCAQFKPGSDGFAIDQRPPGYRWFRLHADGWAETGVEWADAESLAADPPHARSSVA
ncbi:MAG TPA: metallophosphoesterase [Steroidobacteraceae bacterium]|nr:metallophosphoesterase [Steroidobacteraceae bacterium]